MDKSRIQELIQRAIEQMRFSYVPYSNFRVGAALLTACKNAGGELDLEPALQEIASRGRYV